MNAYPYRGGSPVTNQGAPIIIQSQEKFRSVPVSVTCQFCHTPVTTNVHKTCNCLNTLLCIFTGLLIWICIQCCRKKEITCCDAKHTCPNCGQQLGYYDSC